MINQMKTQAFLNGASVADIYTDAFLVASVNFISKEM
jgi:hypothetical protein